MPVLLMAANVHVLHQHILVVCKAECSYEQDCVQCDGCEAWMHTGCIQ